MFYRASQSFYPQESDCLRFCISLLQRLLKCIIFIFNQPTHYAIYGQNLSCWDYCFIISVSVLHFPIICHNTPCQVFCCLILVPNIHFLISCHIFCRVHNSSILTLTSHWRIMCHNPSCQQQFNQFGIKVTSFFLINWHNPICQEYTSITTTSYNKAPLIRYKIERLEWHIQH